MNPALIDPHNHAPEVSPDDEWGDVDGYLPAVQPAEAGPAPVVLPPKRPKPEQSTGGDQEGLRIESKPMLRPAEDSVHQLEVQEIDGSVVRLDPELPTAPKVPRQITFHEKPAENPEAHERRGEGREWGMVGKHSRRWVLGTGLAVAGVVVAALMMLPKINEANAAKPRPGDMGLVVDRDHNVKAIEAINDMLARQPEAEQIFRKFASATIAEDVLPLIREASTIEALIRKAPPAMAVAKEWDPAGNTTWNVFEDKGKPFGILEGSLPDFSKFSAYLDLTDGQLHLDWKATTGYGTATFTELEKGEGNPSEIRAYAKPSGYYSATFPESDYQNYQLLAPDNEHAIWCYTRRGEPVAAQLAALFSGGEIVASSQDLRRVTLRLKRAPDGSLPNQWLVEEMLHKDWITP